MDESIVTIVRSIIAFAILLLYTRFLGKQQVGQLTAFEYAAGITIGSIAGTLSIDLSTKPLPQFLGLTTWVVLVFGLQKVSTKFRWFSKVVGDQPVIVVQKGKILEENLKNMRLRHDELMAHLREKDVFDITQVEFAILEVNGNLSVLKKPQYEPVTPNDLKITPSVNGIVTEVIYDGVIIEENLKNRDKTKEWLHQQLQANGITDVKEVSFAAILPNNKLYVDKFKDNINKINIGDFDGPY